MTHDTVLSPYRPTPTTGRAAGTAAGTGGWLARVSAFVGALAALAAVVTIWVARVVTADDVYVSQLGAQGAPTADVFNAALLTLALGGLLVAVGCRGQRSTVRILGAWSVSTTLALAGVAFVVASRVTCTAGCPVPLTDGSSIQDLAHVTAAVVGFAGAAWAMLQVGWSALPRPVRYASRGAALSVALASCAGGLLSVAGAGTGTGARLEFVAMTVAVLWLAGFASWVSLQCNRT